MPASAHSTPALRIPPLSGDPRSAERIHAHYLVERELADRLRRSDRESRRTLYTDVYEELFRRVPDHPQIAHKADPVARAGHVAGQLSILRRFLAPSKTFLEVGAGDCALTLAASPLVKEAIAVEVSSQVSTRDIVPANFTLRISDGQSIPAPPASVDVIYSNQLMEHLHPDDAEQQLRSIRETLAPGGVYVCVTPNRLTGPHDVSMYFDEVATGFHLREYTIGSLAALMRTSGFRRVRVVAMLRGMSAVVPVGPFAVLERMLDALGPGAGGRIARLPVLRALLDVRLAAWR